MERTENGIREDGMRDDEFRKVRMRMNGIRCGMRRGSTGKLWMMERNENRRRQTMGGCCG